MRPRLWLAAVTLFWLAMIVWLWRTEFGQRRQPGNVPVGVVWQKILTAPDSSRLDIFYVTNSIGSCHWRPDVGQELATGARLVDDNPLEGMVQKLTHYSLDLEGTMALPDFPSRVRFSFQLRLDTNQNWQNFNAYISIRPDLYELNADAIAQTVSIRVDAGGDQINRTFQFADFENPQKLLTDFGGPLFPAMVAAFGVPLRTNQVTATTLRLNWQAHNDSLLIGRNRVRAYRLEAKVLDHYRLTFYISPVGELLRAELPGELVLVNEALAGLRHGMP